MKKPKTVYNIYSDPGHAWVKVELEEVVKLGLLDKISSYSYVKQFSKAYAYLEEDCDIALFIEAKERLEGVEISYRDHCSRSKQSKIRSYYSFGSLDIDALLSQFVRLKGLKGHPEVAKTMARRVVKTLKRGA